MPRRITAFVGLWILLIGGTLSSVSAQVQGGLTALPEVKLGTNLLANGGFETIGSPPVSWSGGTNWNVDQLVKKSGSYSWRRGTGAPTATQRVKLRKGTYKVSAWIKTETLGSASAGVRLQLDLRPAVNFWYKTDVISGTADWTLHELKNIVLTEDREVTIKLENLANPSGTAWFDDVKLEEQQGEPVNAFLLYPNYRGILFTDKPQTLRIDVTVTPPGDDFAKYAVRATLADETSGTVVRSQTYAAQAHFVAQLDGSVMETGKGYLLRVALVDKATSATVYTYPAYRVSRQPGTARAAMNVAFDEKNRLLVRGTPRFLLGVYDAGMGYGTTDAFWEDKLWSPTGERRMDGLKINFYLNYWYGEAPAPAMTARMANLQKHGVMYLQTGNCFNTRPADDTFLINRSADYVRDLTGHPGAAGFYTVDECVSALAPRGLRPEQAAARAGAGHGDVRRALRPSGHRALARRRGPAVQRPVPDVRGRARRWLQPPPGRRLDGGDAQGRQGRPAGRDRAAVLQVHLAGPLADPAGDAQPRLHGHRGGRSGPVVVEPRHQRPQGRLRGLVRAEDRSHDQPQGRRQRAGGAGARRTLAASGTRFTDSFGPYQAHVYVIGAAGTGGSDPTPEADVEPSPEPASPTAGASQSPEPAPGPGAGSPSGQAVGGVTGQTAGSPTTQTAGSPTSQTAETPTVAFTNPQAGASLKGTATVSMQASGGSGSGYTYTVTVGGTTVYSGANPSFSWNTTTVPDGDRTLTATVKDTAGATATANLQVTLANGEGTPTPSPTGAVGLAVPASDPTLGGALPHRTDFLTNPDCQGSIGTTFYALADGPARARCRNGTTSRGYTHLYVSITSGDHHYYGNARAFRARLQELIDDGIKPVVWLTSDTGPWKDGPIARMTADLTDFIPQIDDLVSSYVLGIEMGEYWTRAEADQIGRHIEDAHQQARGGTSKLRSVGLLSLELVRLHGAAVHGTHRGRYSRPDPPRHQRSRQTGRRG